jgi:DNA repair exonuclease SbcCD ATPase subunit
MCTNTATLMSPLPVASSALLAKMVREKASFCLQWVSLFMVVTEMQDGSFFIVTREFPSGAATLVCGNEKITGPSKVNAWILKKLNTEKGILENLVFVGQKEIDAILFSRPTEKERLAQNFFSLGGAAIIETSLTKALGSLSMDSLADRLKGFEVEAVSAQLELGEIQRQIAGIPQSSVLESQVLGLDKQVAQASSLNSAIQTVQALIPGRDSLKSEYDRRDVEYRSAYQVYNKFDWATTRAERDKHLLCEQTRAARAGVIVRRDSLLDERSSLGDRPHSDHYVEGAKNQLDLMATELAEISSRLTDVRANLKKVGTTSVCSACGGVIDISSRPQLEASEEQLLTKLAPTKERVEQGERLYRAISQAVWQWDQKKERLDREIKDAETELSGKLQDPGFEPDSQKYAKQMEEYDQVSRTLIAMHTELMKAGKQYAEANLKIESQQSDFPSVQLASAKLVDISGLQDQLTALRLQIKETNAVEERLRSAESRLRNANKMVIDARSAASSNAAAIEIRQTLEAGRAVFHPGGAPKTLITRSNRMLESSINHYLGMMGCNFTVTARDGLSFDANFNDGIALDHELSVGQKASLAWSFRLAGCETFSSSVGLMTMDEPTAALDKDVLQGFLSVIGIMRQLHVTHGMQFFIATHSTEIEKECDQVIRIS